MSEDTQSGMPTPVVTAVLICDQAIRDEITERVTLVGILTRIASETFPFQYRRGVTLYARLSDAAGPYSVRLQLVRLDDDVNIGSMEFDVTLGDRMDASELLCQSDALTFDRPGRYEFRLFANSRYLGAAPLDVVEARQEGHPWQ